MNRSRTTPLRIGVRRAAATALAISLLVLSAGCGDQEKAYCGALKSDQKMFAEMRDDTSGLALLKHRTALHQLADQAPSDLHDEWQTFLGAIDTFARTLHDAGVAPGDFVDGQAPAGVSAETRTRIAQAANELASDDVVTAANGIEQQAKDVCKLQLGL
jgi:hypothetical protein